MTRARLSASAPSCSGHVAGSSTCSTKVRTTPGCPGPAGICSWVSATSPASSRWTVRSPASACRPPSIFSPPAVGRHDAEVHQVVGRPVGGPPGLEHERAAALEPQERGREVLHLVGRLPALVGGVPRRAAQAARAELGVGGRVHAEHAGLAEQVQGVVQHVHADVDQRSAAGLLAVGEPAAEHRDAAAAQPGGARVVGAPDLAGRDDRGERLDVGAQAVVERHLEDAPGLARGVHHLLPLVAVARDGLLAEHVQPALQRGDRDGGVQERRHGDAHRVEAGHVQQVGPGGQPVLDGVLLAERLQQLRLLRGDGDDLDLVERGVRGQVLLPGPAQADHPDLEGRGLWCVCHVRGAPW